MDLQALQTELMARGYDYLSALRQNYFLNRAYTEYCVRFPWPWLEVKVSQQPLPHVPDPTLRAMLWLVDDKNVNDLEGVDYRDIRKLDPAGTHTGTRTAGTSTAQPLTSTLTTPTPRLATSTSAFHPPWSTLQMFPSFQKSFNC